MSTLTITPTYRDRDDLARAPAKLARTMLEVVVAGSADGARFQRGRAYARDGVVVVLHVSTGRLEAEVSGTRSSEYEVTIDVVLARGAPKDASNAPAALVPLVPEPDDLRYSCTCPDPADVCKHAVAALIAFAAEVGDRPDLLRLWRVGSIERAKVGAARADRSAAPTPPPRAEPWEAPAWRAYLGTADDSPRAPEVHELLPALAPPAAERVGAFDVAAFVVSAAPRSPESPNPSAAGRAKVASNGREHNPTY